MKKPKRRDTRLESEGAEFLVLAHLLIEGMSAYKCYVNLPGHDLTVVNHETGRTAKIQVKSRWSAGAASFPIKNFACDFVAFVALNRRSDDKTGKKGSSTNGCPHIYMFPADLVRQHHDTGSTWRKAHIHRIPDWESYRDNWKLVREFLGRG
jgi:hypothetical protein